MLPRRWTLQAAALRIKAVTFDLQVAQLSAEKQPSGFSWIYPDRTNNLDCFSGTWRKWARVFEGQGAGLSFSPDLSDLPDLWAHVCLISAALPGGNRMVKHYVKGN